MLGKLHLRIYLIRAVGPYYQFLRTSVVAEGPPNLGLRHLWSKWSVWVQIYNPN